MLLLTVGVPKEAEKEPAVVSKVEVTPEGAPTPDGGQAEPEYPAQYCVRKDRVSVMSASSTSTLMSTLPEPSVRGMALLSVIVGAESAFTI